MERMKVLFPNLDYCSSAYDTLKGVDAALLVTEWGEFKKLSLDKMKRAMTSPILIDGRNIFDPAEAARLGFTYHCIGRPSAVGAASQRMTAKV
jgi:UDPglucose 6-dehydrogenase